MFYRTLMIFTLLLSLQFETGCDTNAVVSRVRLKLTPLDYPLDTTEGEFLEGEGEVVVTAYDVDKDSLYQSVSFSLNDKEGDVPTLPLGTWRFFINGVSDNTSFFGATGPFKVEEQTATQVQALVGKSHCTGLLPPQPSYDEFLMYKS